MPKKRATPDISKQKLNSPQQKSSKSDSSEGKHVPEVKRTPDGTVEENSEEAAP